MPCTLSTPYFSASGTLPTGQRQPSHPIGVSWANGEGAMTKNSFGITPQSGTESEQLMGKKSQVILIGGSPGLNSKHVLLSPGCQDLTERAKDNLNNVGWAAEISVHCCSRGNGVLRMSEILTRLPARRSLLFLIRNVILRASFSSPLGLERA